MLRQQLLTSFAAIPLEKTCVLWFMDAASSKLPNQILALRGGTEVPKFHLLHRRWLEPSEIWSTRSIVYCLKMNHSKLSWSHAQSHFLKLLVKIRLAPGACSSSIACARKKIKRKRWKRKEQRKRKKNKNKRKEGKEKRKRENYLLKIRLVNFRSDCQPVSFEVCSRVIAWTCFFP